MTLPGSLHGWAAFGTLALLLALNHMPAWFAGTRLAVFADQLNIRIRLSKPREDLDALLAGYYEALVRKSTTLTVRYDFLQQGYVPHRVHPKRPDQRITNSFAMFDREYSQQKPAGTRSDPPMSEPISSAVTRAASAAAAPPEEPPVVRDASQGLFEAP